jgi:hypothetical protein
MDSFDAKSTRTGFRHTHRWTVAKPDMQGAWLILETRLTLCISTKILTAHRGQTDIGYR